MSIYANFMFIYPLINGRGHTQGPRRQVFNHKKSPLFSVFRIPCSVFAPSPYLCIQFIGWNQHICVISRKFLTHLSLELTADGQDQGPRTKDLHKTNGHGCVCQPLCPAKMCDRQDLSSNNRHFGQPIDPLVTRCLTLSENIILITDHTRGAHGAGWMDGWLGMWMRMWMRMWMWMSLSRRRRRWVLPRHGRLLPASEL